MPRGSTDHTETKESFRQKLSSVEQIAWRNESSSRRHRTIRPGCIVSRQDRSIRSALCVDKLSFGCGRLAQAKRDRLQLPVSRNPKDTPFRTAGGVPAGCSGDRTGSGLRQPGGCLCSQPNTAHPSDQMSQLGRYRGAERTAGACREPCRSKFRVCGGGTLQDDPLVVCPPPATAAAGVRSRGGCPKAVALPPSRNRRRRRRSEGRPCCRAVNKLRCKQMRTARCMSRHPHMCAAALQRALECEQPRPRPILPRAMDDAHSLREMQALGSNRVTSTPGLVFATLQALRNFHPLANATVLPPGANA